MPSSTNVVSLQAPKGEATSPPSDHGLIRDCVAYAQAIGGYHAGFAADVTGNNEFAGHEPSASGDRLFNRACKLLVSISRTPATTARGLSAKARVAQIVIDDHSGDILENETVAFFTSFASEVNDFLKPLIK